MNGMKKKTLRVACLMPFHIENSLHCVHVCAQKWDDDDDDVDGGGTQIAIQYAAHAKRILFATRKCFFLIDYRLGG